jgi:hypothetical protein
MMMGVYGGLCSLDTLQLQTEYKSEWNDQCLSAKVKSFYSYLYEMIHSTSLSSCLSC